METDQPFRTLPDILNESLRAHGERPLFGTKRDGEWQWTSYKQFGDLVLDMRDGLAGLGVGKGDRVAIISGNRLEWAVCAHATWALGAVFVPMYESQKEHEWEFILRDCAPKVLFVSTPAVAKRVRVFFEDLKVVRHLCPIEGEPGHPYRYDALLTWGQSNPGLAAEISPDDLACLIYTSGTTGDPKGVMLSHDNIVSNVSEVRKLFPLGPDDRCLSFLPWAHVFGQTGELHTFMSLGASIAICEGLPMLKANMVEVRPTVLCAVPGIFEKIHDGVRKDIASRPAPIRWLFRRGLAGGVITRPIAERFIFPKIREKFGGRLRFAISGGAALGREVGEFIDAIGIEVYEGYGLTETSPVISVNHPGNREMGTVGPILPGVTVRIDTAASGDPRDGEIVVYGPNVMKGYYNHPDETAGVTTADGGFRTGDLGRIEDGRLHITGRIKAQFKLSSNGKYVAPEPLESQLKTSPFIADVMLHGANRPHVIALIVPKEGADQASIAGDLQRLMEGWKSYERVKDFIVVTEPFTIENGMLTPKLSLKRRAVVEKYGAQIDALYRK